MLKNVDLMLHNLFFYNELRIYIIKFIFFNIINQIWGLFSLFERLN